MRRRTTHAGRGTRGYILAVAAALTVTLAGGASPGNAVIGGRDTPTPGFMAFVVAQTSTGGQACTGTAIRPNVILTAAHCVVDGDINTYLAPNKISAITGQDNPLSGLQNHTAPINPVMNYITPKGYRHLANGISIYDVALLQMRDPIAQTVALIPQDRTDLWGPTVPSTLLGWGLTRGGDTTSSAANLQSGILAVDLPTNCGRRVLGFSAAVMLCTTTAGPARSCEGDSGGPLLAEDLATRTLYEVGVVSFGAANCDPGSSSFFANVAAPTLGNFVDTYATQLQQAADSTPATTPPPSAPPTPVATPTVTQPPPTPVGTPTATQPPPASATTFSLKQALIRIDTTIENFTQAQAVSRYGCARKNSQSFRCTMTWRGRNATYRGTMVVSADFIQFTGRSATRRCQRRHTFKHCAKPFEFST